MFEALFMVLYFGLGILFLTPEQKKKAIDEEKEEILRDGSFVIIKTRNKR